MGSIKYGGYVGRSRQRESAAGIGDDGATIAASNRAATFDDLTDNPLLRWQAGDASFSHHPL